MTSALPAGWTRAAEPFPDARLSDAQAVAAIAALAGLTDDARRVAKAALTKAGIFESACAPGARWDGTTVADMEARAGAFLAPDGYPPLPAPAPFAVSAAAPPQWADDADPVAARITARGERNRRLHAVHRLAQDESNYNPTEAQITAEVERARLAAVEVSEQLGRLAGVTPAAPRQDVPAEVRATLVERGRIPAGSGEDGFHR